MDALDLLRFQAKQAYAWLEMTVSDVTEEQANWQPPGTANSIGATYAHVMISADEDFNTQLHGRTTLIAGAWAGRVGLSELGRGVWLALAGVGVTRSHRLVSFPRVRW